MKTRCLFFAVLLVCSSPIHAAMDAFLKLDDIKGESVDAQFRDHIEVDSWAWAITGMPYIYGGQTSGKATFNSLNITKNVDKASPILMLGCASGTHYKELILSLRKAGENPQVYIRMTMTDVVVSSYSMSGGAAGSELPTEQVSFNFGKVKVEYIPQTADGKPGIPVVFSWDIAANQRL